MPDTAPEPNTPPAFEPNSDTLRPSAVVQPFDSGGGPPPDLTPQRKKSHAGLAVIIVLLILGAAGAGAYATYGNPFVRPTPVPSSTPQPQGLSASFDALDVSMGEVDTNFADAESSINDKAGDLSE